MTNAQTGLPDFMEGHILVAFHRGDDQSFEAAVSQLSDEEMDIQTMLESRGEGDYPAMDVAVVHAIEQAEGVTSYSGEIAAATLEEILGDTHPTGDRFHRPVLDLDMNAALIPSGTPGHFHLYIDKLIPWSKYEQLLIALSDCGIIEPGYMQASIDRGYSSARLPTKPKKIGD